MNIETILLIGVAIVLLIAVPTIANLLQKQRIQGNFIGIKDADIDELYVSILLSTGEGEKEILIYKSCLERIQKGQYITLIKRKFESIYSLNFVIGER